MKKQNKSKNIKFEVCFFESFTHRQQQMMPWRDVAKWHLINWEWAKETYVKGWDLYGNSVHRFCFKQLKKEVPGFSVTHDTCMCAATSRRRDLSSSSSMGLSGMFDEVVSSWQVLPLLPLCVRACVCPCVCVRVCVCSRARRTWAAEHSRNKARGTEMQWHLSRSLSPSARLTLCYPLMNRMGGGGGG